MQFTRLKFELLRNIDNLARIHKPMWIQCCLDALHDPNCIYPEFLNKRVFFTQTNAVLSCASAIHLKGSIDHVVDALFHCFALTFIFTIIEDTFVKISITNMS